VHHGEPREGENRLDHLWIRVRDLVESRFFYETVAPTVGLRVRYGAANRFPRQRGRRSIAVVREDPVTENVQLGSRLRPRVRGGVQQPRPSRPVSATTALPPSAGRKCAPTNPKTSRRHISGTVD
jgi:hypothetical protein